MIEQGVMELLVKVLVNIRNFEKVLFWYFCFICSITFRSPSFLCGLRFIPFFLLIFKLFELCPMYNFQVPAEASDITRVVNDLFSTCFTLALSVLQVCEEALEYQLLVSEDGGHDGGGDGKVANRESR